MWALQFVFLCRDSSQLFATSSKDDVRVWHARSGKELLRLTLTNLTCHAVAITPDGKAIITGEGTQGHGHCTVIEHTRLVFSMG